VDFGWLIVFGVFWIIFSAIREGTQAVRKPPRRREDVRDAFAATSPGLRELLEAIEQARRPVRQPTPAPPPAAAPRVRRLDPSGSDRPDDFVSLESTAEEVVVERAVTRVARRDVDLDDESIAIAAKRRTQADRLHEAPKPAAARKSTFPEAVAADATAVAVPQPTDAIRQAIIWREILGPPRSLQDD